MSPSKINTVEKKAGSQNSVCMSEGEREREGETEKTREVII